MSSTLKRGGVGYFIQSLNKNGPIETKNGVMLSMDVFNVPTISTKMNSSKNRFLLLQYGKQNKEDCSWKIDESTQVLLAKIIRGSLWLQQREKSVDVLATNRKLWGRMDNFELRKLRRFPFFPYSSYTRK